jgi:hypothetical protein
MSKCTVELHLEGEDPVFSPGDPVRGTVQVTSGEPCDVRRLVLRREWRTHGKGNTDRGGPEDVTLATDLSLIPGAPQTFSFEFEAPEEPFTYRGGIINVDWYVRAEADLAWARDPGAEAEIILRPEPSDGSAEPVDTPLRPVRIADLPTGVIDKLKAVEAPRRWQLPKGVETVKLSTPVGCALFGCVVVFLIVPFLMFGGVLLTTLVEATPGWVSGPVLLALAALIGYFVFRNRLAAKRLGDTQLKIGSQAVHRGATLDWFLECEPPSPVTLRSVVATLTRTEVATSGSGTRRTTHRQVLDAREMRVDDVALEGGEAVVFPGRFAIGHDTPFSFKGDSNEVLWELKVNVDLPNWPDWTRKVPVEVVP